MKRIVLFICLLTSIFILFVFPESLASNAFSRQSGNPASFVENKGQIIDQNSKPNPAVLYLLNNPGMNVQLRKTGFSYDLYRVSNQLEGNRQKAIGNSSSHVPRPMSQPSINYHRIDIDLENSNPNPTIIPSEPSSDYLNYYTTGTPEKGATFVRSYQKIVYKNIYPSIDLEFLMDPVKGFKYNIVVRPGGNLENVHIQITDPEINLSSDGQLKLLTAIGTIEEDIPFSTYKIDNDSVTTTNAQPFRLKGGIPLGGTYSGPGVTNGIFYPAIAGAGTHQITYTYTNAALCSAYAIVTIVTRNTLPLTCGNLLTDIRDNHAYPTIQIGSQCWLASHLEFGTSIPETQSQRDNCIAEKYSRYASPVTRYDFYQWDELMAYDETLSTQGLCPPGWHVPTEADWNTLFATYISNAFAAWPLLSSGYSGFNATLSGTRHMNVTWDWSGFATFFWSSTPHGATKAWSHGLNGTDPSVSLYPAYRSNAFSVRCLKD